jgi:hypothetical protein
MKITPSPVRQDMKTMPQWWFVMMFVSFLLLFILLAGVTLVNVG